MIVGIDVNLRQINCCQLLPAERPRFITYHVGESLTSLECPRWIANEIRQRRPFTADDVVWIERPMGMQIKSVSDLCRVMGAVIAALPLETSIEEVTAPEWKKLCGLPGNAGKVEVYAWAMAELARRGEDFAAHRLDEHRCDALAIAVACERESQRATEHEGQVIA